MANLKRPFLRGDLSGQPAASEPADERTPTDEPARLTEAVLPPDEGIRDASDDPAPPVATTSTEAVAAAGTPPLPDNLADAHAYQTELQRKMTALADDFSQGKINRQQFDAVYAHYRDQRQLIEGLIRSMAADAWRKAVTPGQTGLLMDRHAARLLSCALYDNPTAALLAASPRFQIDAEVVAPVIAAHLQAVSRGTHASSLPAPADHWLHFVPGQYSTLVVVFTREPARSQWQFLHDLHHDFELASAKRLTDGRGREAAEAFMRTWALEDPR
jgi:hypothetical protein